MLPYELLKAMQSQVDFNETDQKRLQEIGLWLLPYSVGLAKTFYAPFDKCPVNKALLDSLPGRRTKLRLLVGDWYTGVFNGPYDMAYAQRRWIMGVVHFRLNIPLVLMVNAIESVYRCSARQVGESAPWLKGPVIGYIVSLTKMLNIDLAFVGQSYAESSPTMGFSPSNADGRTCQGLMACELGDLLEEAHIQAQA